METSIKRSMWGFSEKTVGLWNKTQKNDFVAFYATSPISRVIGFGKVVDKSVNSERIWSDEILFKRSIWKYKIHLEIFHIIKDLAFGINVPQRLMLNTGRKVISEELFRTIVQKADSKWHTKLYSKIFDQMRK